MRWVWRLLPVLVVSVLAGCAAVEKLSGKERIEEAKPNPLEKIEATVKIERNWSYNVGAGSAESSFHNLVPTLRGDTFYAASPDGYVSAIDAVSGKRKWRINADVPISGAIGAGIDVLLIGTPEGEVKGLSIDNGEELWTQKLSSEILAPPAAYGGVAVVRTIDGHVYGLSSSNGEQQWVFHRQVPTLTLRGNSAPLVVDRAVVVGFANGRLVAASLTDGRVVWDVSIAQARGVNEVERMIDIDSTPVLVGSVLYVSAFQGSVTALALGSRNVLWSKEVSSYTPVSADSDNIYVSDDEGRVIALDRLTGELIWEQTGLLNRNLSGPAALDRYVVVTDFDGYAHVLSKSDGQIIGRSKVSGGRLTGPSIVHQGAIHSMNENGDLVSISIKDSS